MKWVWIAAVLALPGAGAAQERVLRTEATVHAPVAQVWKAFTTEDGVRSWMVPVAEVDFRVGGTIQTNYNPDARIGDPGTIVHHIVSYEPERVLAMHFDASATSPEWAKLAQATWVVYRFEPIGADQTRVTISMMGWGTGPAWDDSYQHFEKGNAWEMEQLVKRFAPKSAPPSQSDSRK